MLKTDGPKRAHTFSPPLPNCKAISNIVKVHHITDCLLCFNKIYNKKQLAIVLWVGSQIRDQL